MIVIDTSVLVDSLTAPRRLSAQLRDAIERGEHLMLPSLVLYEWLRGPRSPSELAAQEVLFPSQKTILFGLPEAAVSAQLYRLIARPRGREMDIAIAACAVVRDVPLWTANARDFSDIPGLRLWNPKATK